MKTKAGTRAQSAALTAPQDSAVRALQAQVEEMDETILLLQQASHRFQELFQGLPTACFCYDERGRIFEWNRACESVYGWRADQVLQKPFYDLLCSPETVEDAKACVARVLAGEVLEDLEWVHSCLDGTQRAMLGNAFPLRRADGLVVGAISASVDITERKQAAQARHESEERLRTVITNAPLILFALDAQGVFTLSEGQGLAAMGLTPGQVVGQSVFELYRDVPVVLADCQRALTGEAFRSSLEVAGQAYETWYSPLQSAQGEVGGVIGVSFDVTARRQAEEALRQAHEELEQRVAERTRELADANQALQQQMAERSEADKELQRVLAQSEQLLASISSILIGVDGRGLVTAWNAAAQRCFGKPASQVLGRPFSDSSIPWEWERVHSGAKRAKDNAEVVRLDDVRYTRLDGKECFLGMSLNPINGYMGEASGFMLLATDITERRILESQLAQSQKLESIGQLAAGIAHEINTPIQYLGDNTRFLQDSFTDLRGVLAAYARLAERAQMGGPIPPDLLAEVDAAVQAADVDYLLGEIPQAIGQSLEGVERVTHIVRAMKEFSHPGTAQKTPIDLNHALESTLTVARNEWKYVADAVTDFDPHLPLVPCLPADLNQVFLNIIVNAAHAIADVVGDGAGGKGTLTVSTRAAGDWVEARIADSGTGIPEAIRSRIFDPFFTTKEVGRGTGQGLAISHVVVVEKHGGTLTLESEVGRGTTFVIRLPVHAADSARDGDARRAA